MPWRRTRQWRSTEVAVVVTTGWLTAIVEATLAVVGDVWTRTSTSMAQRRTGKPGELQEPLQSRRGARRGTEPQEPRRSDQNRPNEWLTVTGAALLSHGSVPDLGDGARYAIPHR
jgi:hypothetical protein